VALKFIGVTSRISRWWNKYARGFTLGDLPGFAVFAWVSRRMMSGRSPGPASRRKGKRWKIMKGRMKGSRYCRRIKFTALVEGIILGFVSASILWYGTLQFATKFVGR